MKVVANLTFMFQEAGSLLNRYSAAADAGFTAVECAFPYLNSLDDLHNCLKAHNLTQVLINAPDENWHKGSRGVACLSSSINEYKSSIHLAATYAKRLECSKIHVMAGIVPESHNQMEYASAYMANIKYAAQVFAQNNIDCLIEPINAFSMTNYFLNSYDQAINFIEQIQEPNVKLLLDVFHAQQISGNLTRTIKKCMPYIGHVQVAQVPDRHEPGSAGEIQYEYIFKLLKQLNYNGYIGLEYIPEQSTVQGLGWIENYSLMKC